MKKKNLLSQVANDLNPIAEAYGYTKVKLFTWKKETSDDVTLRIEFHVFHIEREFNIVVSCDSKQMTLISLPQYVHMEWEYAAIGVVDIYNHDMRLENNDPIPIPYTSDEASEIIPKYQSTLVKILKEFESLHTAFDIIDFVRNKPRYAEIGRVSLDYIEGVIRGDMDLIKYPDIEAYRDEFQKI